MKDNTFFNKTYKSIFTLSLKSFKNDDMKTYDFFLFINFTIL